MVTLKNNELEVKINELGAEIKSIIYAGKEQMWQGDEQIWSGTAPVLFPICGAVKDDKYTYEGKEYTLNQHGFARKTIFDVVETDDTKAVFSLKSNEATKAVYPFDFELYITYEINNTSVKISYDVKNKTDGDMYFSIGSHEAYSAPEGVEDYDVVFEKQESLATNVMAGRYITDNTMPMLKNGNVLPIYEKYFMIDSLVLLGINSRKVILRNRKTDRQIKIEFPNCKNMLIWHKPNAPYICIEPWAGSADRLDNNYDITKKEDIIKLSKGENYNNIHTITF